jgi:hypothetical protein
MTGKESSDIDLGNDLEYDTINIIIKSKNTKETKTE